jgi:hypothetical protein
LTTDLYTDIADNVSPLDQGANKHLNTSSKIRENYKGLHSSKMLITNLGRVLMHNYTTVVLCPYASYCASTFPSQYRDQLRAVQPRHWDLVPGRAEILRWCRLAVTYCLLVSRVSFHGALSCWIAR